jgi:predicted dehydrogenase
MKSERTTRRHFLQQSALSASAVAAAPYILKNPKAIAGTVANGRHRIGSVGTGGRWGSLVGAANRFGDHVAVCDVDRRRAEKGKARSGGKADIFQDYHHVLDNNDIDIVIVATPDHWHAKIAIEAMQAGKDVYCEKPMTLTIEEGQQICKVVKDTGRIFQVGTQQRSEWKSRFLQAIAICQAGRLGKIRRASCPIGNPGPGGPFSATDPPAELDWNMWLGQTPLVAYRRQRCHYNFRYWYEYAGGQITDWGAHHVDIATWALGLGETGPISVEGTGKHSVPLENGYPTQDDAYNTANSFNITCKFASGQEIVIGGPDENGVLIEGDKGRIFVNRGKVVGKPVEDLVDNPLPEDAITKLYKGKQPGDHMRNFFECVADRSQPISDVFTHHRSLTTCHLANIAIRLGRPLKWDPQNEAIVGDEEAAGFIRREQRRGFEIKV